MTIEQKTTALTIKGLCNQIDMHSYYYEEQLDHDEKASALLWALLDLYSETLTGKPLDEETSNDIYYWLYSTEKPTKKE